MVELSNEDLERLIEQTRAVANICATHGELDGRTAALSQLRALERELATRHG
jgi:hypothetical protein